MPKPSVAEFVDAFFTRTLFQDDDVVASSVLASELSPDAVINMNGNDLTTESFINLINTQFRPAFSAKVLEIRDLNIVTTNTEGTTGVVAQYTRYETSGKSDNTILKQSATTIVAVEERDGKRSITRIWEAQTVDTD
ncbi:uncharacterized protein I206_107331 [Kwoniella pini CBS 10737]|uniref:SnoaL-like domain-containing protein n=1 Tax=Kwoniella pini CBS 10737 TaxID=1296096 RepID=A0A1B9HYN1_9TREE|nr:uncharacterized protein I206_05125 [Kwoniella pini CBS 10737]OCF48348.1 hypothetical protein I206_05125 [Kwoniella pini CBS 10737]